MKLTGGLDELAHRRALRRWARIAEKARHLDPFSLRTLRNQADILRSYLDRVILTADERLAGDGPRLDWPAGDWAWRPGLWETAQRPAYLIAPESGARLGYDLKVFHDCRTPSLILRQHAGPSETPNVSLEVFDFDGSFLSLVIDLPASALDGLGHHHTLTASLLVDAEREIEFVGRLNLQQGPNTVQMIDDAERSEGRIVFDFDLAYSDMTEGRVEAAWLDVILSDPSMNEIRVLDLTVGRQTRAEI